MARIDAIVDFETFGVSTKCAIIDLSVLVFDWGRFGDNPYTYEELLGMTKKFKLDVADQVKNYGYVIEPDTLKFWQGQPKEVQAQIKPQKHDLKVKDFVYDFIWYISNRGEKIEYWWSRNNTFDPPILWRLAHTENKWHTFEQYLPHWRVRDVKTWIDAKFDFNTLSGFQPLADEEYWKKTFKQHDSAHDVVGDVLRLQAIYRAENGLEQTSR